MISREMENMVHFISRLQAGAVPPDLDQIRANLDQMAAMIHPDPEVTTQAGIAGGVPVKWFDGPNGAGDRFVIYFHGGGYAGGSPETHRDLLSRLARETGRRVLAVDYRLAPEHPFPAALEDAVAAYRWLLNSTGARPRNVVAAGDSAGGGLTLAMLVRLRDEGDPLPAAGVCLSPWTDLAMTGDSVRDLIDEDPFLTPVQLDFFSDLYRQGTDAVNPMVSPLYADLAGLPPLLVQTGGRELLLDDSVRLAEKARAAGVEVELEIWEEMVHGFQGFAAVAPEGVEAVRRIAEYLKKF